MTASRATELIAEAREVLGPLLARLAGRQDVEGIAVLSSMAATGQRVTFDELSDIDLTVWVRAGMRFHEWRPDPRATRRLLADRLPTWLGNFSFHVPMRWGMVEVNLHQRVIEYDADPRTVWDDAMREAHAYTAQVVYDRHGRVGRLIKAKTRMSGSERSDRLIRLASRLEWDIRRAPERMVLRGDIAAGHYVLAAAVDEIIELLYVLGSRFVPHRKWRLAGLSRYGLASAEDISLLDEAMRITALTEQEFYRRVEVLETLWANLRPRLPRDMPTDVYRFYSAHVSANRQLRTRTVADEIADRYSQRLGPGVYDLTNYLIPGGLDEVASLDEQGAQALPPPWRNLARSLRDQVRHDLARSVRGRGDADAAGEPVDTATGNVGEGAA
ncbi:MAG: DUF4037 domain-containing protein [Actinobacteria bacterium]|nr:MAG: DUF4037 domain-containing protein [Actinomycetota bacterium]